MTTDSLNQDDLYGVLGIHDRYADVTSQDLRIAYKKALLKHHPDKHGVKQTRPALSIDQISLAYKILSDTTLRAEYDAACRTEENLPIKFKIFHSGLDTFDLDDLRYDRASSTWTKTCRCGDGGGFVITEDELEANIEDGELITGCQGCSLWIKVLFSAEE